MTVQVIHVSMVEDVKTWLMASNVHVPLAFLAKTVKVIPRIYFFFDKKSMPI